MNEIEKAIKEARQAQVGRIYNGMSNAKQVTAPETEETVSKAEEPAEEQEVEKSDIMYAISGGENPIRVSKTGKEIKEQVENVVLPELNETLATCKSEADALLEKCGKAPTHKPDNYWCGGVDFDCGYKVYYWDDTYYEDSQKNIYPTLSAEDAESKLGNKPKTQEEANARREYNEKVRCICNVMTDIKACEVLTKLDEKKSYELTARQIFALKF